MFCKVWNYTLLESWWTHSPNGPDVSTMLSLCLNLDHNLDAQSESCSYSAAAMTHLFNWMPCGVGSDQDPHFDLTLNAVW